MKTKKVSLIAGISVCALIVLFTVVYAVITDAFVFAEEYVPPVDIEESYAKDAIEWVLKNKWMSTESVGGQPYFHPEDKVTRGELAKILAAYLDLDSGQYDEVTLGFADEASIPAQDLAYIRAALAGGYVKLFSDYTYRASSPVARAEAADVFAPLCPTAVSAGKSKNFSDFSDVGPYFEDSVKKLVDLEIMIGYPDGTLRPRNAITREELAMVLYRLSLTEKSP